MNIKNYFLVKGIIIMKIEVIKNKKLDLKIPEFTCDSGIAPHLNKYPMLSHLNCFGFTAIVGRPGSGKTSMLVSFLTGKGENKVWRKVFNHVLVVMPSTSRASMRKNIFKTHDADKMWDDLDYKTITNIYDRLEEASTNKETTLLILDDIGASLKRKDIQTMLRKIIYNRRHLKCHIIILLQSYMSIPKEIRKIFTNVILFKPSKVEAENLFNELFEMNKDDTLDLMNYAFKEKHQSLFLNVETQKIYKDFDQLVVHTDSDSEIENSDSEK